jgi:osmotically-inducible protein OsmY
MITTESALVDRIDAAIQTCPYFQGKKLRIEAADGRIVLKGNVSSYFQKQMAQETVRRVQGVHQIENDLQVEWPIVSIASTMRETA